MDELKDTIRMSLTYSIEELKRQSFSSTKTRPHSVWKETSCGKDELMHKPNREQSWDMSLLGVICYWNA